MNLSFPFNLIVLYVYLTKISHNSLPIIKKHIKKTMRTEIYRKYTCKPSNPQKVNPTIQK